MTMTIDEAIKILRDPEPANHIYTVMELREANHMGIEALKRCKLQEPFASYHLGEPLPGETEE